MEVVGHTATSTELQEQSSFGSIFYHTHSQSLITLCIQQWGLENHRLPHFHVLPLTHKLHFFIFLIYLAKMMILALEKQRVNPRKIKSSMASIFRHGTRYAELGGRREKKINRKAYQSQQRALGSMIIRGQWDAHMG